MKRYIYGMSVTRSFLLGKMEGYSEVIQEHILKIVTAHQTGSAKYIDKWIGDTSRAVYNVSKYTIGNKNKRLSAEAYEKFLLDSIFGNSEQDMKSSLEDFKQYYPEYSNFVIDEDLTKVLFNIVKDLRQLIPSMIAEHTDSEGIPIPQIRNELRNLIHKYIDFDSGEDNWRK